jgi:pimeloyl-ACP methyl ester carboxylesterase
MTRSVFHCQGLALSTVALGEGRPFVFQHGLCGQASQTAEVFPQGQGWQCLTLECRGHGQSEAGDPAAFSLATFSDDVAAFIASLDQGPVVLGGISMGAAIALRIAATRPALVKGLVLARPAWLDAPSPDHLAPNREVGALLRTHTPDEALRQFELSATAQRLSSEAPDNLASLRSFFARQPLDMTAHLLSAIASDGPGISRAAMARLRMPTLVIGHGRDAIHPLPLARELASYIPAAQFYEITAKADDVMKYRRDFSAALTRFLKELPQ